LIPNPILKVLSTFQSSGVRALLMGGQACVFYGGAEFSRDTDFAIEADAANLERLNAAMRELRRFRLSSVQDARHNGMGVCGGGGDWNNYRPEFKDGKVLGPTLLVSSRRDAPCCLRIDPDHARNTVVAQGHPKPARRGGGGGA